MNKEMKKELDALTEQLHLYTELDRKLIAILISSFMLTYKFGAFATYCDSRIVDVEQAVNVTLLDLTNLRFSIYELAAVEPEQIEAMEKQLDTFISRLINKHYADEGAHKKATILLS